MFEVINILLCLVYEYYFIIILRSKFDYTYIFISFLRDYSVNDALISIIFMFDNYINWFRIIFIENDLALFDEQIPKCTNTQFYLVLFYVLAF